MLEDSGKVIVKSSTGPSFVVNPSRKVFEQPGGLRKIGDSLYRNAGQATPEAIPAQLVTGALERSTVDPVQELVAMIETQRAYEANAQMIRIQDQTLGRAISGLTQNV